MRVTVGAAKRALKATTHAQGRLARRVVNLVLRAAAKEIVLHQTQCIWRKQTPSGSPQRPNAPSTQALKRAKGIAQIPLRMSGVLVNPQAWRIWHDGRYEVQILPPPSRNQAVDNVKRLGYRIYEMPPFEMQRTLFNRAVGRMTPGDEVKLWFAGWID